MNPIIEHKINAARSEVNRDSMPPEAELLTAALAAKREQSAAYLALLDALENGNAAGVKAAAKAARQKHQKGTP